MAAESLKGVFALEHEKKKFLKYQSGIAHENRRRRQSLGGKGRLMLQIALSTLRFNTTF
jgi:hypothetical protein